MKKFFMAMVILLALMFSVSTSQARMVQIDEDVILLTGTVTLQDGMDFELMTNSMTDGDVDEIIILIDSPGGYEIAMWDTVNQMEYLQKFYDIKFVTVNIKVAASAAAVIWLAGDELQAVQGASFMFHMAYLVNSWGMMAPYNQLPPSWKRHIDGCNAKMAHWILDRTGKVEYVLAFMASGYGGENWFTVWEMQELGLDVKQIP